MTHADRVANALHHLTGMLIVVRNDSFDITQGTYASLDPFNPAISEEQAVLVDGLPICSGTRACAVGSLCLGAGLSVRETQAVSTYAWIDRVGLDENATRKENADSLRPGLALAWETLDDAALRYMDSLSKEDRDAIEEGFEDSPMERLFENWHLDEDDLAALVRSAIAYLLDQA